MFVILVQSPKTTGINGNPSIPSKALGITFLAILMLILVSALIVLPVDVLYRPRLTRLPLNTGVSHPIYSVFYQENWENKSRLKSNYQFRYQGDSDLPIDSFKKNRQSRTN